MKLSEGESWNYDYDAFVKWEKAHPTSTRAATRSAVETIDKTPVHIPPVIVGKTWKEVINEQSRAVYNTRLLFFYGGFII